MSKKSRRTRSKNRTQVPLGRGETKSGSEHSKLVFEPKRPATSVELSSSVTDAVHHQYVLPELRRIGIIAGALLLVLIVLTFILG